jgi:hypothetical protein
LVLVGGASVTEELAFTICRAGLVSGELVYVLGGLASIHGGLVSVSRQLVSISKELVSIYGGCGFRNRGTDLQILGVASVSGELVSISWELLPYSGSWSPFSEI